MSNYPKTRREQEVWQACDDLIAKDLTVKEVTGEAIAVRLRELHYKVGSTTQRYQYRDTWMAARGLSREEQGRGVSDISDPIARAATLFKEGIERELRLEYEKKYQHLQAELAEKENLLQQKVAQLQNLKNELNESIQAHDLLKERYKVQSQSWQALNEEGISHKTLISQLQQQAAKAQSLYQSHLENLQNMVLTHRNESQQQLAHVEKTYQAYTADLKEASETQRQRLIVELDNAKMVLKRLQQTQIKDQEEHSLLKQRYSELQGTHTQVQASLDQALCEQKNQRLQDVEAYKQQGALLEALSVQQQTFEQTLKPLSQVYQAVRQIQKQVEVLSQTHEAVTADE